MATATEATIRAWVDTTLKTVPNSGVVHDYERWSSDWSDYLDLFKTTIGSDEVIRGWTITCSSISNRQYITQQVLETKSAHLKTYAYIIRGYFGLDDENESEKAAIALAEDVIEKLESYPKLGSTLEIGKYTDEGWPRLEAFEPRSYGGVLCHYIEIRFEVWEVGLVTYSGI